MPWVNNHQSSDGEAVCVHACVHTCVCVLGHSFNPPAVCNSALAIIFYLHQAPMSVRGKKCRAFSGVFCACTQPCKCKWPPRSQGIWYFSFPRSSFYIFWPDSFLFAPIATAAMVLSDCYLLFSTNALEVGTFPLSELWTRSNKNSVNEYFSKELLDMSSRDNSLRTGLFEDLQT